MDSTNKIIVNCSNDVLNLKETANVLHCSKEYVYKLLKQKALPAAKVGSKYLIQRNDIITFLNHKKTVTK